MKRIHLFFGAVLFLVVACNDQKSSSTVYISDTFTLSDSQVTQGKHQAVALSSTEMESTYQSPANATFPRHLEFKFSLNGKDNELPFGVNHHEILYPKEGETTVKVREFGVADEEIPETPQGDFLEANTAVTIQVDLSVVLEAFEEQGFYEGSDGSRLAKEDFKGVYVAGNLEPLSWDFENLPSRPYAKLEDPDGDGVYSCTLTLNAYNEDNFTAGQWTLSEDLSQFPTYTSGRPLMDALYQLSLEEMLADIRPDGTFRAGEKWDGVWTRDISYSILLSLALLNPEAAKASLQAKTKNGRVIQDTGTGGAWPISTDRMTWALAAWEVYLVTQDEAWLREAYDLLALSAQHDLKTIIDPQTNLMRGESSFLDWRKQSYPRWMGPIDIYNSQNLGTNAVHYQTYRILGSMARLLGESDEQWEEVANTLKVAINEHLWVKEKGYYGQYRYGREFMQLSERSESLGEALCVLFGIAEGKRAAQVMLNTPVVEYGVPCFYPQIPGIPPYHNNGIWPFVQAYYTWAAAEVGNTEAVEFGMAGIYRAAGLFLTNKENMVAETGDFEGTEINSDAQLWSVAGNLSLVYRVLLGLRFSPEGLRFQPFVPQAYAGEHAVKGIKYGEATLNITVKGFGNQISSIQGLESTDINQVLSPESLGSGTHDIVITMADKIEGESGINLLENHFSLHTPVPEQDNGNLMGGGEVGETWRLLANGAEMDTWPSMLNTVYNETSLRVQDSLGWWSFMSEPESNAQNIGIHLEAETFRGARSQRTGAQGYRSQGFVELTKTGNTNVATSFTIEQAGWYRLDARYSNGSGPINTNNQCAMRSVYLGDAPWGVLVMPQLGFEEWSTWGFTNGLRQFFEPGRYTVTLKFEDHNENMNFETNRAFLDYLRLVRLPGEPQP